MKFILWLLWIALLGYGAWRLKDRPRRPSSPSATGGCASVAQKYTMQHVVARRDMPVNWRVGSADINAEAAGSPAAGDFIGKYVACKASAGDPLVLSDLKMKLETPASGKTLYRLRLKPHEEDWLNAGKRVDLFLGATPVLANVEILGVECDAQCEAILQLTAGEIAALEKIDPLALKKSLH